MSMKRIAITWAILSLAIATVLLSQSPTQATLRLPQGDRQVTTVEQFPHTFLAADEFVAAMGGSIVRDSRGFRLVIGTLEAAFGTDSNFGVVGDDLIEMPISPMIIDGRPFAPWEFFRDVLALGGRDLRWDPIQKLLVVRPLIRQNVSVQVSIVDLEEVTRMVLEMSGPASYVLRRETDAFVLQFRQPLVAPFPERGFENRFIRRISFQGSEIRVQLTSSEVAGDSYRLEKPFRVVLDLRRGEAPPPTPAGQPPARRIKPLDLPGVRTIVLDPGHGGKEVGAVGANGLMEKDTTLAICQKLSGLVLSRLGTRVVLTRYDDSMVPLEQRTAIANQYKADLFLSVHLNAAPIRNAHGSETYFLSVEASDDFARRAAERENAPAAASSSGAVPSSDLRLILWDLAQQQYLKESSRFAELVQEEMNVVSGVTSRGVKQAPFKVLVGANMPAALVEVGFISNPAEEAKLRGEEFQNTVANALLKAIERYKTEIDAKSGVASTTLPAPASASSVRRGSS